jgi:hypothetical protein
MLACTPACTAKCMSPVHCLSLIMACAEICCKALRSRYYLTLTWQYSSCAGTDVSNALSTSTFTADRRAFNYCFAITNAYSQDPSPPKLAARSLKNSPSSPSPSFNSVKPAQKLVSPARNTPKSTRARAPSSHLNSI